MQMKQRMHTAVRFKEGHRADQCLHGYETQLKTIATLPSATHQVQPSDCKYLQFKIINAFFLEGVAIFQTRCGVVRLPRPIANEKEHNYHARLSPAQEEPPAKHKRRFSLTLMRLQST